MLRFFISPKLFQLYKAQVFSFIESSTWGILHAAPSVFERIDRVKLRFLREIWFTEAEAVERYRLAPLPCRRKIAMMGAFHKITLGIAPSQLAALFSVFGIVPEPPVARNLRGWRLLRNRQLSTPASPMSSAVMKHSVFGICRCYNRLPQHIVDLRSAQLLQRHLQLGLRRFVETGAEDWQGLFSQMWCRVSRQRFNALFELIWLRSTAPYM